jgi:phosphoribosylamine---glycine ligase
MKILIVGSGGREHAIVWALKKNATVPLDIYCAPGNAGIGEDSQLVPIPFSDQTGLANFARGEGIDLTFIGPEAPLAAGIVDHFASERLAIVGPNALAAKLESSKVFAKDFMARHRVPTATYKSAQTPAEALVHLRSGLFGNASTPVVVKADGLAAGKGVIVALSRAEAEAAIEDLMVKHLAGRDAATSVVLEEALSGTEVSLLLFADGKDYVVMPAARDHKRIGENDTGPNTGGMGSITDSSILSPKDLNRVISEVVEPTLVGAEREGFAFKGVLFLGLMLTANGPQLLEYNVRFGDPETQAILVRLQTDLLAIFDAIRTGTLGSLKLQWSEGASACVVAANRGYPGQYETGGIIEGIDAAEKNGVKVFHAGTSRSPAGELVASGGRVIGVTAAAATLPDALEKCYQGLQKVRWPGMQFRRDIGRAKGV